MVNFPIEDTWAVSLKNRLKDYFAAANSIPLLPFEQQPSAIEFTERIDSFIRGSLFPRIRALAERTGNPIKESGYGGHAIVYKQRFVFCDYHCFKENCLKEQEEIFTELSLMTLIPRDRVLPVLADIAGQLNALHRCSPQAIYGSGLEYFPKVSGLMREAEKANFEVLRFDRSNANTPVIVSVPFGSMSFRRAAAQFLCYNYDLKRYRETQSGITIEGTDFIPYALTLSCFIQEVSEECEYGRKGKTRCYAVLPRTGCICLGGADFTFPIPAFASNRFNHLLNRVKIPEYIEKQSAERNEQYERTSDLCRVP